MVVHLGTVCLIHHSHMLAPPWRSGWAGVAMDHWHSPATEVLGSQRFDSNYLSPATCWGCKLEPEEQVPPQRRRRWLCQHQPPPPLSRQLLLWGLLSIHLCCLLCCAGIDGLTGSHPFLFHHLTLWCLKKKYIYYVIINLIYLEHFP